MKQIFFLVAIVISSITYAQRNDNAITIQAKAGVMEVLKWKGDGKGELIKDLPTTASLGTQWFIGQRGYFVEGNAIMQDFSINHTELNKAIPYQLYGLNIMGGWSFENLHPLYINLKAGGFGGYYTVNKGKRKEDVYGTTFTNPVEGISYGAIASAELEIVIWKRLSGVLSYGQYFYVNDKWIRWQYTAEVGLKWYL